MAIISTKTAIDSINADNTVFTVSTYSQEDTSKDEFSLWLVARHVNIYAHTQGAVSLSGQGAGLTTIEIYCIVADGLCSMTTRGLMDILPGKPF